MPVPISPEITEGPLLHRIDGAMGRLPKLVYRVLSELDAEGWVTPEPKPYAERMQGEHKRLKQGDVWGKLWDCAWFHFTGTVPKEAMEGTGVLLIDIGGEGCVVDENGTPLIGLTTLGSGFDYSLGKPGKHVVPLSLLKLNEDKVEVWVDAGCNDLFGSLPSGGALVQAAIAERREEMQALCFDFEVLRELLNYLPRTSARYAKILRGLYDATLVLSPEPTDEEVSCARTILSPLLAAQGGDPSLRVSAIGHAHIDLAWLWPVRETFRKGARTFSTVLRMMERYPDYLFGASQAQLYQWMKELYPSLYTQIKQRIAEGRWEVQGGMWVEADANIPSGESLVRQFLYGKRFFLSEFGVDVRNLWLPDVFGYSGSLPQIMRKAGIDFFLTQKLSWSKFNTHPHHTFLWEGIDGSEVLVHMPPENTYNSPASPRAIAAAEANYLDKGVSDECMVLFGIGDGGGGPGEEHLERLKREKNLQGLPPVRQEFACDFFDRLSLSSEKYARWTGELYLERHEGTLTTQARTKRANRKLEIALRELEIAAVRAMISTGYQYPMEALERIWKEALFMQFHDILPGSSITRVYEETLARYAALMEETIGLTEEADRALLGKGDQTAVANSLSWDRTEWVRINGEWRLVKAPALSVSPVVAFDVSDHDANATQSCLENDHLRVTFNTAGDIVSIFDKDNSREVLRKGETGNHLIVFEDAGDAWDFSPDYYVVKPSETTLVSSVSSLDGPVAVMHQTRKYGDSVLSQEIRLASGSRRLDFVTHVDWKERHKMLRVRFPLAIRSEHARCEIQFGNIERPTTMNTSWETAKQEVCGQKWVDISDAGYGVALLNDCKYGHRVHGCTLDLDLLRSPSYPDPIADQAEHDITYSLFPHAGDYTDGGVVHAAYELNMPLRVIPSVKGVSDGCSSLLRLDSDDVVVEAIKKAEDEDAVIIRMYEAHGRSTNASVRFGFPVKSAEIVNLMEQKESSLEVREDQVDVSLNPFEIITLKVNAK
jgi:alpha-mannosidase